MKIPISKPLFDKDEERASLEPLRNGWVMQGPKVQKFEKMISSYTRTKYARATSSGTAALHLSLLACEIKPGDEIIVPPFTCVASVNPIEYIGGKPVFVDIDLKTYNIDSSKIEEAITENTKAIVPIHLFGLCADMDPILELAKKYSLRIIEDAALALGAFYNGEHAGTFGDAGCFSFHPRKAITTGEGGMVITNNEEIAHQIEIMRNYGASISALERHQKELYALPQYNILGYNYKMTDIQANIGIQQMGKLEFILKRRTELARIYNQELKDLKWLIIPHVTEGCTHAYQSYVCLFAPDGLPKEGADSDELEIMCQKRNEFMKWLHGKGISTVPGALAIHTVDYYKGKYNLNQTDFLSCLIASKLSIALPLYPQMREEEQDYVIHHTKHFGKTRI
ncbi:MAG: hypothetical protein AMJ92_04205 [candidate division Zixibacteria bacterium SM23_81]|nr:MAG: hypothetical protein AMJ92_04205 [candidate division Zixibacteria bacterium SM23_81]